MILKTYLRKKAGETNTLPTFPVFPSEHAYADIIKPRNEESQRWFMYISGPIHGRYNEEQSLQLTDLTFRIRTRCLLINGEVNDVLQE